MNKTTLKKYANAVVNFGANVQEGQYVVINASIEQKSFVVELVKACYARKARFVKVDWTCDELSILNLQNVEYKTYLENYKLTLNQMDFYSKILPCRIYVEDSDPDLLNGIDTSKSIKARVKMYPKLKKYVDMMDNRYQWVICAMPSYKWANKVFPNDSKKVAYKKLEDAIIKTTRIDGNATKNWLSHIQTLKAKSDILNELNLDSLHYKSQNGTDLKIKLMPNHYWISARENTLGSNIDFTANMPTEEVFTMPSFDGVDGVVYSTKPLSLRGKLVENFKIYFENGKVVKVEAEKNQDVLEKLLEDDEGSSHLGEVALVPYSSPISDSKILFYNTLFDENASCHLALGAAFKNNIRGYENLSDEDFKKMNFNESMNHVDFMIGSEDLEIVGYKHNGEKVQIFSKGNWAI